MPVNGEQASPLVAVDRWCSLRFIQRGRSLPSGAAHKCGTHPSDVQVKQKTHKAALRGKFWPTILIIAFLLPSSFV